MHEYVSGVELLLKVNWEIDILVLHYWNIPFLQFKVLIGIRISTNSENLQLPT